MKNRKNIIIVTIVLITLIGVLLIFQKHPINGYSGVINQIDKKETFSVLLTSNNSANLEKTLNYYEEAYNIKVEYLDINFNNKGFLESSSII